MAIDKKRRLARRLAVAPRLWAAALLLLAGPALADDAAPGAGASELYGQGVKLAEQKDYKGAEAKFLAAWAIQRSYDVAANIGEMQMQIGRPADAAVYFTYAVANFPLGGKPQTREWITGRLKEARSKVFALAISVNVPGAEVRIGGKVVGKAPLGDEQFLLPGEHTVEVTAPDYEPWSRKIPAAAGGSQKLQVDLVLPQRSLLPGVAVGGAGVAALVAGVALYVVSTGKYDEAKRLHDEIESDPVNARHCVAPGANPKCAALKSAAETSDALQAPSIALLVGGGLLMGAGGAYLGYVLRPPSAPETGKGPRVTAFGVRGAGVFVQGSF